MLPGIVLAAGDSRRMGSPKALLPTPEGRFFLERILETLAAADVSPVVAVLGRDHDAIVFALEESRGPMPLVARNPDPSKGQLSSLWIGMDRVVTPATEGLLVTLVDVPAVAASTVRQVVSAWRETRKPIVRPAIGSRHGHPVVFDKALFDELRQADLATGAKSVVRAHERDILNVPVDDEGCLADVDTPDDFRRLHAR
jgi:molybdenum cofactor cytidylyltransferase